MAHETVLMCILLLLPIQAFPQDRHYIIDTIHVKSEVLNEIRSIIIYQSTNISRTDSVNFLYLIDGEYSDHRFQRIKERFNDSIPNLIAIGISFFEKHILPTNRNLSKTELRLIIKANFNKHFKYQSRPPQWIQNPSWIVRDDKPLFFIGQLELKNEVAHDHGFVYVFLDTETGIIDTVTQFY